MSTLPSVELTQAGPGNSSSRRAWLFIVMLTAALTGISTYQSLRRYQELRSGWSWDLAYYNQWFWALTQGDGIVTVRPVSAYAQEGPSIWKMNYLAPIRLALVPFYRMLPGPLTLLVIQNVDVLVGDPGGLYAGALGDRGRRPWRSRPRRSCP